jgi:valyl-tRNA synthetase
VSNAKELGPSYTPSAIEPRVAERWAASNYSDPDARPRANGDLPPFTIIMPPPNVTGGLHVGHALFVTLEDLLVRRARMQGRAALWLPGVDHASIAAQFVLDKVIAAEGESRASLGRERYLERMHTFMDETRGVILGQFRRLGASADWGRTRFTMDEMSSRAVRTAFATLYERGLAYRTEALVNWCPGCKTSVSDLESVAAEEQGSIWEIRYPLEGGASDSGVVVATTRPETLLGDTGVAVHPADPRYASLVGRRVVVPFVERAVPIVADDFVDQAFGTGAVKLTPAHDPNDREAGLRHNLPAPTILDESARIVPDAPAPFAGMDRFAARKAIVAALEERGQLVSVKPHTANPARCQRSNDILEPRLRTQWFIKAKPLAEKALAATREGKTTIVPAHFEKTWEHWLTEIRDWNVSRQLWWGHRIPAWYCSEGHITVTADAAGPAGCSACGAPPEALTQESDIFDTWFSSGLWPFSTLGWPDQTPDLARYYPSQVMETGHDILFFWVARMMMLGIELMGEPPFETIYLHGMVRDPEGAKMSKTKGNVVDPLSLIDEVGADALRFALVSGTAPGADQRLAPEKLENSRNFMNKLWNAARYVLGARPDVPIGDRPQGRDAYAAAGPYGAWLAARTEAAVVDVEHALATYAFSEAAQRIYDALWAEYCDQAIELAKVTLADPAVSPEMRAATWWSLVESLDTLLRLLHPMAPFITEGIWEALPHREGEADLLAVAEWPTAHGTPTGASAEIDAWLELVREVRAARTAAKLPAGAWLPLTVAAPASLQQIGMMLAPAIERLARVRPLLIQETFGGDAEGLLVVAGNLTARLAAPAADPDALAADRERRAKDLAAARTQLAAAEARLADPSFTGKAPPAVVDGAERRAKELRDEIARLEGEGG